MNLSSYLKDIDTYMRENNIKHMSEQKTIGILKQIRDGFAELRKRGVIHRDVKLANIFLHNDTVIIGKLSYLFRNCGW